jgi:hypothetical protein
MFYKLLWDISEYESLTAEREQVRKIHNMSFRHLDVLLLQKNTKMAKTHVVTCSLSAVSDSYIYIYPHTGLILCTGVVCVEASVALFKQRQCYNESLGITAIRYGPRELSQQSAKARNGILFSSPLCPDRLDAIQPIRGSFLWDKVVGA